MRTGRKFAALWIMVLILSFPFAFAQQLSIVKFQGSAGVDGYARSQDDVTIEALASLGGLPVNESRVRLYLGSNYDLFQSCVQDSGDFYRCTYAGPMQWYGSLDFDVKLYDYEVPPNMVAQSSQSILIDDIAPVVRSFSASPQTTSGPVQFSFVVEDYGLQYGTPQDCSGVKKVTITAGSDDIVTDFGTEGDCSKQETVDFTFAPPSGEDEYTVCARAEDFVGLESTPSCVNVVVDNAAPNMSGFAIVDPDELFEISHVRPGQQRNAHIIAVIQDEGGVDTASVRGYFGQLNQNFPDFIPPTRIIQDTAFVWENVPVSEVSGCQATIRADDVLGNTNEQSFSCDIAADDVGPTVLNVSAGQIKDGRHLIGYDTELSVTFEDLDEDGNTGVGLQSKNAFLDLRDLGLGGSVRADVCTKQNSRWACSWTIRPSLPSGDYVAYVTTDTRDDLGNELVEEYQVDLTYDTDGPKQPVIIESRVVGQDPGRQTPVRGDTLVYTVRSEDFVRANANFSSVGGESAVPAVGCSATNTSDEFDCTFQSYIYFSGYIEGRIDFNFFDEANNRASVSTDVTVYGLLNDTHPDHWTHSLECSPSGEAGPDVPLVSRFLNEQVGQSFSCVARLRPNAPGKQLEPISIVGPQSVTDCASDNIALFDSVSVMNTQSAEPVLFFTLAPQTLPGDSVLIECPIHITSSKDGAITRHAEQEDVLVNVSFHDVSAAGLYDSYEERVENQFDKVDGFGEWMDPLRKFVAISEAACNIKNLLANVLGIIQTFVALVEGVEAGLDALGGLGSIITPTRVGICQGAEGSQATYEQSAAPFLDQYCAMSNCQAMTGKSWTRYVGGGMPWCSAYDQWMNDELGFSSTERGGSGWQGLNLGQQLPVEDSLFLSSACLCLPGIVKNLDKLRQNECRRASCMANDYVTLGLAASACDEQYHYLTCSYITGEVWNVVPFSRFLDMVGDMIAEWIANPWSIATTALGTGCSLLCQSAPTVHSGCALVRVASVMAEAWGSIEAMVEAEDYFGGSVGDEWCREYEEVRKEWDGE